MSYRPHIQSDKTSLFSALALTAAYQDHTAPIRLKGFNQALVEVLVAGFDATSVEIQVELANPNGDGTPAATDWFGQVYLDTAAATIAATDATVPIRRLTYQMLGDGALIIPIPVCYKWMRVRVKRTGGSAATLLTGNLAYGLV